MSSPFHDRVQARAIRAALSPRTAPVALELVPHFIKSLLSSSGIPLPEVDEWGERLERSLERNKGEIDETLRRAAVKLADKSHEGCQLAGLVLNTLAMKYAKSNADINPILDALDTPQPYFPTLAVQRRYRIGWLRVALKTLPTSRSEHNQKKIIDRVLAIGLDSPPALATRWYREALQQWNVNPSDEQRENMRLLAGRTELPTAVIIKNPSYGEGSDAKSRKRVFSHMEIPLPLPVMPTSATTIIGTLSSEFPWLSNAIAAVALDLLVAENYRHGVACLSPKLLHGEPGSGKTTFIFRVAQLLGQPTATLSAAGVGSPRILLGVPRGYSTARSSFPLELMSLHKSPACLVNVDEVDKISTGSQNGSFNDALLSFLEPTSNGRYFDEYALGECDFSHVSWLLTANDLEKISAPLLSRMEIIHCAQPKPEHMSIIAAHTMDAIRREFRLDSSVEVLDDQAQAELRVAQGHLKSAREVSRLVRSKFGQSLERRFAPRTGAPKPDEKRRLQLH